MESGPDPLDEELVGRLREIVLKNLSDENFSVDDLAREVGFNRYYIYRKIKATKNQNAVRFIRDIRLDEALELLKQNAGSAAEIAYRVGFGSPAYFNKCFHDRFGYPPGETRKRMVHDVTVTDSAEEGTGSLNPIRDSDSETHKNKYFSKRRITGILTAAAGVLLCILFLWALSDHNREKEGNTTLVVVPFSNYSDDPQYQFFADGITEAILNDLLKIGNLNVLSRISAMEFMDNPGSLQEITRAANADYVLEGSVQKDGSRIRIMVQLIDGRNFRHKWSNYYDREFGDIFSIQSDIARNIADQLDIMLTDKEITDIESRSTVNTEAYILYLKGRHFLNQRTEASIEKSIEYYKMSLNEDPDFALAYTGLADAFLTLSLLSWVDSEDGYAEAIEAARKAIKLNKDLSEAHAVLGSLLCWFERRWEDSRRELLLAIDLNPKSENAHYYYSQLLNILGENEEARKHINIALGINPFNLGANYESIIYYYNEGKFNESLKEIERVSDMIPEKRKYYYSKLNYLLLGDDNSYAESLYRYFLVDPASSHYGQVVKEIFSAEGKEGLLRYLIRFELAKPSPRYYLLAYYYASLDQKEEAISCLGKAYDKFTFELPNMNNDPFFWSLRTEPGFQELIKKIGLSDYSGHYSR